MFHINIFFIRLLSRLGLSNLFSTSLSLTSGDINIKIPIVNGIGIQHFKESEPWMSVVLNAFPHQSGLFVDVGANVGQTLIQYVIHQPATQYLGFEPNAACSNYLQTLIAANSWKNVRVIPSALTKTTGKQTLSFYSKQLTDSSATLIKNFRPGQKVIAENTIDTISWHDLEDIDKTEKIVWLKIDVEGSEWEVFQTMATKIQADLPHIMVEILPVYHLGNIERWKRQQQLESEILRWGYTIFRILISKNQKISLEKLDTIGIHGDMNATNYLLIHEKRLGEMNQLG